MPLETALDTKVKPLKDRVPPREKDYRASFYVDLVVYRALRVYACERLVRLRDVSNIAIKEYLRREMGEEAFTAMFQRQEELVEQERQEVLKLKAPTLDK